jgi:hypothetical protein
MVRSLGADVVIDYTREVCLQKPETRRGRIRHVTRFRRGLAIPSGRHRSVGTHYRFRVISGTRSGAGV